MGKVNTKILQTPFGNTLQNLYFRWLDEFEYENIEDYKNVLVKSIIANNGEPLEITEAKATKRPFGVKFTTKEGEKWQVSINSRYMSIKRIG